MTEASGAVQMGVSGVGGADGKGARAGGVTAAPRGSFLDGGRGRMPSVVPSESGSEEAARRKRAEFEREALPHLDGLYTAALRFAGRDVAAEDLVQETMLKAYRNWHQYEKGTNCRAWLLAILRNTFVSHFRKRKTRGRRLEYRDELALETPDRPDRRTPDDALFESLVDQEVLRAIDKLPEFYRSVLVLSDLTGLSYREVADVLGVPEGTVKSRLFRARRSLRERLHEYAREMGYIS